MYYWDSGMGGAWGFVMMFGMFAFWGLVVIAIIWAVRSSRNRAAVDGRAQQLGAREAELILAGRLARGEIEPDEYRTTLAVLRSGSAS